MPSAIAEIERAIAPRPEDASRRAAEEVARFWRAADDAGDRENASLAIERIGAPLHADETEWIWPMREADLVAPGALSVVGPLLSGAAADAVVMDDVVIDDEGAKLRAKPVFDPLLLLASDYVGRAVAFRRDALAATGASLEDPSFSAAEALSRLAPKRIAHAPYPALLTRAEPFAAKADARMSAAPISIIIPNRDSPALIARCLSGVFTMTDAAEIDVIVVDNGSENEETLEIYRRYEARGDFRVLFDPAPFNFSNMVNAGVAAARHETLLLLNNDVEIIDPRWLAEMIAVLERDGADIVGAKLLFPDRTIQHAGVIVGHGGVAGHDMKGAPDTADDPLGRMRHPHSRSAVTAAAMLTRKDVWRALAGFDARAFPVAFNDVDFCLRARERGYGVAMAPAAVLIHHEGQSRRRGWSMSRYIRHMRERAALRARHGTAGMIDPFENPWRDHEALIPEWRAPKGPLRLRY